jgi:hypothetical protein
MSLISTVDSKLVTIAGRVAARSELQNILLVESNAALSPTFVERGHHVSSEGWSINVGFDRKKVWLKGRTLCTLIRFKFHAKERGAAAKTPLVSITATFFAEYQLAEGFVPDMKEQRAFLATNAVFNCWPFWREYVKSTATRMNLPALTLPFFRILPRTGGEETKILGEGRKHKNAQLT